jgi:hypothetical protein
MIDVIDGMLADDSAIVYQSLQTCDVPTYLFILTCSYNVW